MNGEKNLSISSPTADYLDDVAGESNSLNICQDQTEHSSAEAVQNHSKEDEEHPSSENSQYQLVLYDPAATVNGGETVIDLDPIQSRLHPFSNQAPPKVLPAIGAFTVQCAKCFKWRLIPTKEKYEEIREHIIQRLFFCESAREWRPEISCEDPPDIVQDGSRLWAIDKPNIAQPPPGWQRLMRIRAAGGSKFADVYYVAPTGKRLRSMLEVQRYLDKHPKYVEQGVSLLKFSFQTPRPLQENYVRRRPARRPAPPNYPYDHRMAGPIHTSRVHPIEWVTSPDVDTDLQLSAPPRFPAHCFSASGLNPEINQQPREGNHNHNW